MRSLPPEKLLRGTQRREKEKGRLRLEYDRSELTEAWQQAGVGPAWQKPSSDVVPRGDRLRHDLTVPAVV